MSLINDALKRAKQAQQQNSPDAPQMKVQFRPVEPSQQVKKSDTGIWIAVLIVGGLMIGLVVRQMTRENSPNPKEAKAREIVPANPIPQETAPPAPVAHAATTTSTPKPITLQPAVQQAAAALPADKVEEPAKPAPKLQAVVFDRTRPSAIISGKSVFRGDKVGDFRVVAISQESVTLVGGGQTNVLVLGE